PLPHCTTYVFMFTATATTAIYTLSLHDALPILFQAKKLRRDARINCIRQFDVVLLEGLDHRRRMHARRGAECIFTYDRIIRRNGDRKSTRLNSSHLGISYAVFCLKKKKRD